MRANRFIKYYEEKERKTEGSTPSLIEIEKQNNSSENDRKISSNRFIKHDEERNQSPQNPTPRNKKESLAKQVARYAYQPVAGIAQKFTYPLDLINILGKGEALANLQESQLPGGEYRQLFPELSYENVDEEKYLKGIKEAEESLPTQGNIEKFIEEKTGAPLSPQNQMQKLLRLGGTAGAFKAGTVSQKATATIAAPTISKALQETGVPEGISDFVGLLISGLSSTPKVESKTKPSGLTERRFENVAKPTKITPGRNEKIKEVVEKDFRDLQESLLEKNKTYSSLKEDTLFKEKIGDLFEKVEDLAVDLPKEIHTENIRETLKKRYGEKEFKGITPDEFERSYRKEISKINNSLPSTPITASEALEQYRKNNKSLRELFEPGKSSAFNRAKKEAILEYNQSISDVFKKEYPKSEFNDLFEFTNKRWQEIMDIEQIEKYTQDLFNGKIDYRKAKQLLQRDKEHLSRPFKRILGEEGFKDFKTLTEDLLSTEKGMSYIKKAEEAGWKDFGKLAGSFVLNPIAGKAYVFTKYGKMAYQMLLDKPKLAVTWKNGLDALKEGNYQDSWKYFNKLQEELNRTNQTKQEQNQK